MEDETTMMMRHTALPLAVATLLGGCAFRVDSGDPLSQQTQKAPARHAAHDNTVTPSPDDPKSDDTVAPVASAPPPAAPWDPSAPFTGLRTGHIRGAVGYAAVDDPTDLATVYDDGYYAQVEV